MESISTAINLLVSQAILFIPKLIAAITIFIVGLYLSNLVVKVSIRVLTKRDVRPELTQFISSYGRITLITLVLITTLQQVDFNLTAFIAGLGIVGFTAGFALQDITQNIVSGLILLAQRPFEIGELVEINHFIGYVRQIDVRATTIRTLDGRDVLIPNYSVMSEPITNFSRDPKTRVELQLNIAYDDNIEVVREITRRAILSTPVALQQPPPEILYRSFDDSSLVLTALFWIDIVKTPIREAQDKGVTAVIKAFRQAGIVIPYPIQVELTESPKTSLRIPRKSSENGTSTTS